MFVDIDAPASGDGTSWANAYTSLQDALAEAAAGDEIWVAEGIYHPDRGENVEPGDIEASFQLATVLSLYGGFAGGEATRDQRDWNDHLTILSGDLLKNDNDNVAVNEPTREDNSRHVLAALAAESTIVIDGFIIEGGHAAHGSTGTWPGGESGGGLVVEIEASIILHNVVFRENVAANRGGAIACFGQLDMRDAHLFMNVAGGDVVYGGGAVYLSHDGGGHEYGEGAESRLENVLFEDNRTTMGGAVFVFDTEVHFIDVVFRHNQAHDMAGALYVYESRDRPQDSQFRTVVANTAFIGNTSVRGGGAAAIENSRVLLVNSVFSGNRVTDAQHWGGGVIHLLEYTLLEMVNSTISGNEAFRGGGLYIDAWESTRISNSIIWGNSGDEEDAIYLWDEPDVTVLHSLVEGGIGAGIVDRGGNPAADPLFVDPVGPDGVPGTEDDLLHLQADSPAIDGGLNDALPSDLLDLDRDGDTEELLPLDFAGEPRLAAGGNGIGVVDMGAYEYGDVANSIEERVSGRREQISATVYPNPVGEVGTLVLDGIRPGQLAISVYDSIGQHLGILEKPVYVEGRRLSVELDATHMTAGIYFVKISSAGFATTVPVSVVR